jgi:hypothetical protein
MFSFFIKSIVKEAIREVMIEEQKKNEIVGQGYSLKGTIYDDSLVIDRNFYKKAKIEGIKAGNKRVEVVEDNARVDIVSPKVDEVCDCPHCNNKMFRITERTCSYCGTNVNYKFTGRGGRRMIR